MELRFRQPVVITSIDVKTGFCTFLRGRDLFPINRRIKRARLTIGTWETDHVFEDDLRWQSVRLAAPIGGKSLRVTMVEFFEGSRWPDLHVSEIRVWGYAEQ